jgi:hypothetical protein
MEYRQKIQDLFDYRLFPLLFDLCGESFQYDHPKVIMYYKLQEAIYKLDEVLESDWNVGPLSVSKNHLEIENLLIRAGVPQKSHRQLLKYLFKYEEHELNLRKGLLPGKKSLHKFYFYKSCDVKLIRALIYKDFPMLEQKFPLKNWKNFDLVTEINDDISDLFEDIPTINGNRLMISIFQNGLAKTEEMYLNYLDKIRLYEVENFNDKAYSHELSELVHNETIKNIYDTIELVIINLSNFTPKDLSESLLISHLAI